MGNGYDERDDEVCAVTGRVPLSAGSWIELSIRSFRQLEPRICMMKHFTPQAGPERKNPNVGRLNADCATALAERLIEAAERLIPFVEHWESQSKRTRAR